MRAVETRQIESPYMTVEELAAYIKRKPSTIYKWTHQGTIPVRRHNGGLRFYRPDIDAWNVEKVSRGKVTSLSRFQSARARVRSLKTEHTSIPSVSQKG